MNFLGNLKVNIFAFFIFCVRRSIDVLDTENHGPDPDSLGPDPGLLGLQSMSDTKRQKY